jgi:cyclopropane-fatty-acyl-phospholipid synthase
MWQKVLTKALRRMIRSGTLEVHFPNGESSRFGDGSEPSTTIRIHDPSFARRFLTNPELAAGEGYMRRWYTIDDDDLHGLLGLGIRNIAAGTVVSAETLFGPVLKRVNQFNTARLARRNVAHHYDLSATLYDMFLDADKQYSCAYFRTETDTLEAAQQQKKAHIAKKLCLKPSMRVLDIGCGWGGMALTLAEDFGVDVVGITLSEEQHRIARDRVASAGLAGHVDIRVQDYREIHEQFDRIVSVGMFEHVGVPNYRAYFAQIHDLLTPEGVALVHTIGRITPPGRTSPFIAKYIFPGGYIPSLSEMARAIEKERLWITDLEVWRLHYATTLRHWYDRFVGNIDRAEALYGETFCRMWRFYLAAAEQTFRDGRQAVFQAQLAKAQDAVPLTRDYMHGMS